MSERPFENNLTKQIEEVTEESQPVKDILDIQELEQMRISDSDDENISMLDCNLMEETNKMSQEKHQWEHSNDGSHHPS